MKTTKVFKTGNNTILIVTAKIETTNHSYVSVTAKEIEPITKEAAKQMVREGFEDGELWRMAVEAGQTELGLNDWIDMVISTDGELSGFDNSLYTPEVEINGETYIFDSRSCGCLHDDIKEVTNKFDNLIALHLSSSANAIETAKSIIADIKSDNIDFMVEKFTRQIIAKK